MDNKGDVALVLKWVEVQLHEFLTSNLVECSASRPGSLYLPETEFAPEPIWTRYWRQKLSVS
jgi:hypothetical protein